MQTNSLDEAKRRILTRVSLETLIQDVVPLTRRGNRLTGLCPFHAEKSPSFYVFDDHYHCFGCHAHGDAISFVRQTKELGFIEALRYLAGKYGIEAPELEENAKYQQRRNEQTALLKIMVEAQEFYASELRGPRGGEARAYLSGRGFTADNIDVFGFGLTPAEHFGLVKHLRGLRHRDDDILTVGLGSISAKTGNMYDFFRERITIPIRDVNGRVIAFGGRTTVQDPAKYKNSAATPLFDKSGVLFGLDRAKEFVKQRGRALLVEGYMDTLCLWQEGFQEAVACMGTALNVRQLKLLQSNAKCNEVILLFDGDNAGRNATLESIEVALALPNLRVRAAMLSGGEDPDTFVRAHGAEALQDLLKSAQDLIEVSIAAQLKDATSASIPTKVNELFVPWLSRVQDPVKRSFLVNMVSSRTGVSADILTRQIRSFHFPTNHKGGLQPVAATKASVEEPVFMAMPTRPLTPVEEGFLGHLYHAKPGEIDVAVATEFVQRELNLEPLWDLFCKNILSIHTEQGIPSEKKAELLASYTDEEVKILNRVAETKEESFASSNRQMSMQRLMREQKRQSIQKTISLMKQQIQLAGTRDPDAVPELLQQIMTLHKVLASLTSANADI